MESCKKNMEGYDIKMFLGCYNYYNIKHCAYDASHKPVFFSCKQRAALNPGVMHLD